MKYKVDYRVMLEGSVEIDAESNKDAYRKVREELTPSMCELMENDTLQHSEAFDIKTKIVKK